MNTEQRIEAYVSEATELTFERAFGWEAQHSYPVWANLHQQIEYKMACAKALRNQEPLPPLPENIKEDVEPAPTAIRLDAPVIDIPEEPKAIREVKPKIEKPKTNSVQVRKLVDSMETKFEL